MTVTQVNTDKNHWLPKEIVTGSAGACLAGTSALAIQFLATSHTTTLPSLAGHFVTYGAAATGIVGTVMAVYSMVRLCQKVVTEKNDLHKNIGIIALGVLFTSVVQTIGEHFWKIAPSFFHLHGHTLAYGIATNLAWQIAGIVGISGIAFTAYAAYLTGRAIFATRDV